MLNYYLAIDIGASSGRHIVGWQENGEIKTDEVYRFPNSEDNINSSLCWNIDKLFSEVKIGITKAFCKYPHIESLAIDTWGVDYLLMKDGAPIYPCYAYRDSRTEKIIDEVHRIIPFEDLHRKTGIQFLPFNTIYQLYEDKISGRIQGADSFLMLPDYLNYQLTGVRKREYTNATTTALVNAKSSKYDEEIISALGLPQSLFGKIEYPAAIVGTLCPQISGEVGGNTTVKLVASHDTACAFESVAIADDSLLLSSGTWSLLGIKSKSPILTDQARTFNFTNEGGVGYICFLKNIDGLYTIGQIRKKYNLGFNEAEELAKKGENIELQSAYHALAKSYGTAVSEIEQIAGRYFSSITIIGGGAKDNYLNQLTAAYTGKKVHAQPIEATAIGNLKIQMGVKE